MQPAEVEDVILCPMLGRVIVLVREDQLSLAIGKKGQNVRLASKLVGWDIEVMTREELDEQLDGSVKAFSQVAHITEELAEMLVSQGFFSFDDLSVIEPDQFMEMSGLNEQQVDEIVAHADRESERMEQEQTRRKTLEREVRQAEAKAAEIDASIHADAMAHGGVATPAAEAVEAVVEDTPAEVGSGVADGDVGTEADDGEAGDEEPASSAAVEVETVPAGAEAAVQPTEETAG